MSIKLILCVIFCLLTSFCGYSESVSAETLIKRDRDLWTIGNDYFSRIISVQNGILRTVEVQNRISRETYRTESQEFEILIDDALHLDNGDFSVSGVTALDIPGGKEFVVLLAAKKYPFEAEVKYSVWTDRPYGRKSIRVRNTDNQDHILSAAGLEKMKLRRRVAGSPERAFQNVHLRDYYGERPRFSLTDGSGQWFNSFSDGQPVLGSDLFCGIEFPAAQNRVDDAGAISLNSYLYRKLGGEWVDCRTSVLGFSGEGKSEEAFMEYVDDILVNPLKPVIVYNTWYDIRDLTEENMLGRIDDFIEYYEKPFGFMPDVFLLDDGWDDINSIWEIDKERFPNGFGPVAEKLKAHNVSIGLWVSPFGGYDTRKTARIEHARKRGYEITEHNQYCIGGEKYREEFKRKFFSYMREYGVKFFKLDGIINACNNPEHGHLTGEPSRAALTDAYIEIMQTLKREDPEVCLNITTGFWLSPWWLQYVDMGYPGGFDHWYTKAVPSWTKRDASTVFRDKVLYDKFAGHRYMYPPSALMLIGLIKGDLCMLGGYSERLEEWSNEVALMLMRGYFCWELYLTPSVLSFDERRFMVEALKWGKANQEILSNTRVLSGDPYRREVTVYAHGDGGGCIAGVRNPFIDPRDALITINENIGLDENHQAGRFAVREVYPESRVWDGIYSWGDCILVPIDGFETKILEVASLPGSSGTSGIDKIPVGNDAKPERANEWDLQTSDNSAGFRIDDVYIDDSGDPGRAESIIHCNFYLPSEARLAVLIEGKENADSIRLEVSDNAALSIPVEINPDTTAFGSEHPHDSGDWRWEVYSVAPGNHSLVLKIANRANLRFEGSLGAWVKYHVPGDESTNHISRFAGRAFMENRIPFPSLGKGKSVTKRLFYKPCVF